MADKGTRPLIVRKVVKKAEGHHGGAWKVAYADFVTAMMAFFLLMWLLNATSEEQRKGIADYFDPTLPISRTSSGGLGMLSGESIFAEAELAGMVDRGIKRRPTDPMPLRPDDAGTVPREDAPTDGKAWPDSEAEQTGKASTGELDSEAREAALQADFASAFENIEDAMLKQHFALRVTPEGVSIEVVDLSDDPLFEAGSARPSPILATLLGILVPLLASTTNDLALVGHTDDRPFQPGAAYGNWELSADRANAARRVMTDLGLDASRIARVSGVAATDPFDPDPASPRNRRISVVILREGWR